MNSLVLLREPVITTLGWTLLHFLWQGALIALVFAVADAALRKAGANVRYCVACGAMALMLLSAAGTFCWLGSEVSGAPAATAGTPGPVPGARPAAAQAGPTLPTARLQAEVTTYLPWLVCAWLAGVIVLSARSIGGWVVAQKLKSRNAAPLDPAWAQRARRLAHALGVSRPVRVSKSLLAEVPAVVGWLRPVILVPAGAFVGLDARQLEALLAHELAHIRRHDYLVNLIQTAAETLLFYHPAVWWVGQRIRIERENCCDDLAISACGDVLAYARALTRLEELRAGGSQFAMAADGGALLARIRRLIAAGQPAGHTAKTWLAGVLAVLTVFAVWTAAQISHDGDAAAAGPAAPAFETAEPAPQASPAPAQRSAPAPKPAPAQSKSFIGELAGAGYPNLTVDQLIAFKIHQVTPDYIRELRAAGMTNLTPDELVAFRIHRVEPKQVAELRSAGFAKVTPDQVVSMQIHRVTPEYARQMKGLGFGDPSIEQLVAMKIHNVTPEFANEIKSLGLSGMTIDQLITFRIHRVDAGNVREIQSTGLGALTPEQAVSLRIHNVTPEFLRSLKAAGLTKLSYEDAIAARIHGITPAFIKEAEKHGFKNLTLDRLIRLKQAGILSSDTI